MPRWSARCRSRPSGSRCRTARRSTASRPRARRRARPSSAPCRCRRRRTRRCSCSTGVGATGGSSSNACASAPKRERPNRDKSGSDTSVLALEVGFGEPARDRGARVGQRRRDRAAGHAHHVGDLRLGQVGDVAQDECGALARWQLADDGPRFARGRGNVRIGGPAGQQTRPRARRGAGAGARRSTRRGRRSRRASPSGSPGPTASTRAQASSTASRARSTSPVASSSDAIRRGCSARYHSPKSRAPATAPSSHKWRHFAGSRRRRRSIGSMSDSIEMLDRTFAQTRRIVHARSHGPARRLHELPGLGRARPAGAHRGRDRDGHVGLTGDRPSRPATTPISPDSSPPTTAPRPRPWPHGATAGVLEREVDTPFGRSPGIRLALG